ncbi:cytochrome c family protein [Thermodesulfatator indicus DSM 15286]|uniref:Cytochrome c family protein n=1 Tax=Thermodesulfatator indicus (strain DSM 15286 / JCM 11887 / CIR29812) TaxID=667014 RepID=F8AAJ0_THEID|nr:sulfate reduction electron transfer complex DsrMKJOP subunit DsrJ [Thermodesulfatator indicus]AEH45412.1 cytochrome c family protein [Thermodesulfatator indicus DSM 15286]
MHDAGKVIPGIVVLVVLVTLPFWWNLGKAAPRIELELPKQYKNCVEDRKFMARDHMKLLNEWRNELVRNGQFEYVNSKGQTFPIKFQEGCLKCHPSRSKFCDRCHNFVEVKPYCWNCHYSPEEMKVWATKNVKLKEEAFSKQPASHH